MTKKERFLRVAAALEQLYPDAKCLSVLRQRL